MSGPCIKQHISLEGIDCKVLATTAFEAWASCLVKVKALGWLLLDPLPPGPLPLAPPPDFLPASPCEPLGDKAK